MSRQSEDNNTIKHDSFTVKKKREEKIIFHYDRNERLSMPAAPRRDSMKRGIFKGNRSLLILLLDIIVILILMFIFFRFLNRPSYKKTEQGFQFELEAFPYADNILVSLYVKKTGKAGKSLDKTFKVEFYTSTSSENRETLNGSFPLEPEKETILRSKLSWSGRDETVTASITIGSKVVVLKKNVKKK
ncbi:MAG: hypothetical protein DRP57_06445 [Spirochaetes bacterium]|nr:MAG: hypothetical protein DRP57_06445 [Spirochaetota bacterium]